MRSPSIVVHSGTRGRDPVASRIASASISSTTVFGRRLDRVGAKQAARAAEQAHSLRLEQAGDALAKRPLHAADARAERRHVETAGRFETHRAGTGEIREPVAGPDHRLARDAIPEVRGAADHVAFDQRHLGAERRGDGGRGVSTGSATDDHETYGHDARLRAATRLP